MLNRQGRITFSVLLLAICQYATCLSQSLSEQEELREFHDQAGRAIQARVLEVDGDQVTIERYDGKKFTVAVTLFSPSDQDLIRDLATPRNSPASTNDWTGFRGPSGMGVSDAESLPLEWGAGNNVAWKTPLPGAGASSPIVWGDRIYLTCYTGYLVPDEIFLTWKDCPANFPRS